MGIKTGFNQGNASELIRSMPRQQRKGDVIDVMDDVLERTDGGTECTETQERYRPEKSACAGPDEALGISALWSVHLIVRSW